jgi:hypothetical protein
LDDAKQIRSPDDPKELAVINYRHPFESMGLQNFSDILYRRVGRNADQGTCHYFANGPFATS